MTWQAHSIAALLVANQRWVNQVCRELMNRIRFQTKEQAFQAALERDAAERRMRWKLWFFKKLAAFGVALEKS